MSSLPLIKEHLAQLEVFIGLCKADPKILHHPDLTFFRTYLESLGCKIPNAGKPSAAGEAPKAAKTEQKPKVAPEPEAESGESDVELDMEGVIEPDSGETQPMGDPDKEVSEEDMDKSNEKKRDAIAAFAEGDYEKAADIYTEAILLNPGSALLHAKRGQCYMMMNKPNACIRDCSRALQINPDSAAAYKFRGRANRLLGNWEEAARDLRDACKIDFDEQADEWLREVTPNARRLEEHRRKYERLRADKELREKLDRAQRARQEHAKAARETPTDPGAGDEQDFYKLFSDPEIVQAFKDPEVAAAFQDITKNPANIIKYQNNPKINAIISKLAGKFGAGGMGGLGGLGGLGGFPGFGSAPSGAPAGDDVGLD